MECECEEYNIAIERDRMWIYDKHGEFFTDIKINFCPFCGDKKEG
jgi:hypothetical protein